MHIELTIGIIHWNTPKLLDQQLSKMSMLASSEVIVVDNASQGQEIFDLKKKYSHVHFIQNSCNKGFAHAANQITHQANGEWVLFLNPDALLTTQEIETLLTYAKKNNLIATSPAGSSLNYQKPCATFWSLLVEFTPLSQFIPLSVFPIKTLVGGHLLIQAQALKNLGGWDERFFVWFEDSDLTAKLLKAHQAFQVAKEIHVEHQGGSAVNQLPAHSQKEIFFLSMSQYSDKYFHFLERWLMNKVIKHYSPKELLPSDPSILVSVIIPNIKTELLKEFLEKNISFFDFTQHEVIIVTAVKDLDTFQSLYPNVIFIRQENHKGFAHNVNTGLRRARGRYIGTVNDDTVLSPQWLEILCTYFDDSVASVSPVVLSSLGHVETCGVTVLDCGRAERVTKSHQICETNAFNAACVLFKRESLEEVGLFDEHFESYLEDLDLGLRFKRAGWKNRATNAVSIIHFGQQTSFSLGFYRKWLNCRNWWYVMLKNYSVRHWVIHFPEILLERMRNAFSLIKKN